jgi:hypothetical protein
MHVCAMTDPVNSRQRTLTSRGTAVREASLYHRSPFGPKIPSHVVPFGT